MKIRVLGLVCALSGLVLAEPSGARFVPPASPRQAYDFNRGWRLFVGDPPGAATPGFDDRAWAEVTLPRAWNEDAAFKVAIADLPTGVAWYRKRFRLPPAAPGGKVFLELEGVRQAAEVSLNGRLVGRHENGVMAAGFDLTAFALPYPAENLLAVRTDNDWDYAEKATGTPFQWSNRNFNANYGGIVKNAALHVTGPLYQTLPLFSSLGTVGPYVYARDIDVAARAATVTVETEVRNERDAAEEASLEVVVTEPDGTVTARFAGSATTVPPGGIAVLSAASRVEPLRLWSWGYGALYDVHTILRSGGRVVDAVRTRTGFRQTRFADGMFALNDRVLHLKGYAQRSTNEWPALGPAVPPWLSDLSNRLMVEGNGNLVRWMHVTPSRQDVLSCDRVGLLQALPAGDAEKDAQGRQWEQRLALMRDAIVYNRNQPSVVFYEGGNEEVGEEHMRALVALRDRYDPHGGRAMGSREMLASRAAEWGGEMLYVNKSARHPLWATEYSRDEGLRKYWDEPRPPSTGTETARRIAARPRPSTTATRTRTRWRTSCAGTTSGACGRAPAPASARAPSTSSSPTRTPTSAGPRTTAAAARSTPCASPRTATSRTRRCGTAGSTWSARASTCSATGPTRPAPARTCAWSRARTRSSCS